MSELQTALLVIGLVMVVAVYAFGWWKQRQYRRKFGNAFGQSHDDALYQVNVAQQEQEPQQEPDCRQENRTEPFIMDDSVPINLDILPDEAVHVMPVEAAGEVAATLQHAVTADTTPDKPCTLPDMRCDYTITLHLTEPGIAAVLDGLWRRKSVFRKPVQVCGLTSGTGQWESVMAESQTLYSQFRIALQLVDRGGVISLAKLCEFRDLVSDIARSVHADAAIPDVQETHLGAQSFDAICAEVDQMVGINLLPQGGLRLNGGAIARAAATQGMRLGADGAFHLRNAEGHSLITLVNQDSKPFQPHTLEHFTTSGITLMLDVPRVENPAASFDLMVHRAHALARVLHANLVDDHRVQLTDAGLARIRVQIAGVEARMRENNLIPGSAQARRLFS